MKPPRPAAESGAVADLLGYLSDLGWAEIYRRPPGVEPEVGEPTEGRPESRSEAQDLRALAVAAQSCTRCRLSETRRRVVFGAGDSRAPLMIVGEGPGAEEDRQGLPFVGRAGELLNRILRAIDLERDKVYITNIVKCRPPGNRDPEPDEVSSCAGYLEAQIDAVRPDVLVCLGRVAAQTLLGSDAPVGRMRGQWYEVRGVPTRVTYHPAALLRNATYKRPVWEDMQEVRDRLIEVASTGLRKGERE